MYRTLRQAYTSAPLRRAASGDSFSVVNADASNASFNIYHKTSLALIAITPFALAFGGTTVGKGVDLAMGLAIPVHAHIGMNWVITDYGPKFVGSAGTAGARYVMVGLTAVATLGLLKVNIMGDGLTESVKAMWRKQ